MNIVDEFFILLGLDTDGIDKGLAKAENKLVSGLSGIAAKAAGPLTALFSFAAVGSMFSSMSAEMDRMAKSADSLGVAIEDLQHWGEAVGLAGGSAEGLANTVDGLTKDLSRMAATGTSKAKPFLDELGIASVDASGKARGAFDVLEEIAGKIEGMDKAKSYGLLQNMGLDKGTITLLQSGSKEVKEQLRLQREIGAYSRQDAAAMEKFNGSVDILARTIKIALVPVFKLMADVLSKAAELAGRGIKFMRGHAEALMPTLVLLAATLLSTLVPAIVALGASIWAAMAPLLPFIAAAVALGLLLEDLVVWANGGKSAFAGLWEDIFGEPEKALATFDAIVNVGLPALKEAISGFFEFIKGGFQILFSLFGILGSGIAGLASKFLSLAASITGFGDAAQTTSSIAEKLFNMMEASLDSVIEGAKKLATGPFKMIGALFNFGAGMAEAGDKYGAKIAAGGAVVSTSNNVSNEMTQTVNIQMNSADPVAVGNAVGRATANANAQLANAANAGVR
jgi:hypothetical protein